MWLEEINIVGYVCSDMVETVGWYVYIDHGLN